MLLRSAFAAALLVFAAPAMAQEARTLSGAEIAALVSDNTVEGAMNASGPYRELYLPDGTIRGEDYEGRWSVVGDTLCFAYGESEEPDCWGATISPSNEISWVRDGTVEGTGTIVPGNPNAF